MKVFVATVVALCFVTGSSATLINLINQCPYGVTAFARSGSSATNRYDLGASGGYQQLDVGSSFPAGLIFASTTGSENNAQVWLLDLSLPGPLSGEAWPLDLSFDQRPHHLRASAADQILLRSSGLLKLTFLLQATQLEITAGANGRDTYDISLVVLLDFLRSSCFCYPARASARLHCCLL